MSRTRTFAMIPCRINRWDGWTDLTPMEQWMYYLLRRQEKVSAAGVLEVHVSRWAAEAAGMTKDAVLGLLDGLASKGYIVVDFEQEELLLCWYITTDHVYKKPNPLTAAVNAIEEIGSAGIKTALHNELKALDESEVVPLESVPTIRWLIGQLEPFALIGTTQPLHNPSTTPVLPENRSKVRRVSDMPDTEHNVSTAPEHAEATASEPAQTLPKTGQSNRSAAVVSKQVNNKQKTKDKTLPVADATGEQARPDGLNGGKIVKNWIDSCRTRPPEAIVGQIANRVGKLLAEGIDPEHVQAGVLAWSANGRCAPTVLESFVNQAVQGIAPDRPPRRDDRYAPGTGQRALTPQTSTKIRV